MRVSSITYAMWRLFWAFAYYPLIIGAMIWLYVKDYHWIWGVGVIIAALIFDPFWRLILVKLWRKIKGRA